MAKQKAAPRGPLGQPFLGGAAGLRNWNLEQRGPLFVASNSRRLQSAQILGTLACGPGFLLFLNSIGFWSNPEHPLFMKALVTAFPLLFSLAFFEVVRSRYIEFDPPARELRLYRFPFLYFRATHAEIQGLRLSSAAHILERRGPDAVITQGVLALDLKDGRSLALIEDADRRRLWNLAVELGNQWKGLKVGDA